ncbi:MAG: UPF0149 family protein [Pseudomonadota bacterium]|nr:UPF0149 family protein [Pseudomonadota bacterium]
MTSLQPPNPSDEANDENNALDDAAMATLGALEDALDAMRARRQDVPQWEFCEGVLTAMLCMRRAVSQSEWLHHLLADREGGEAFASEGERTHFLMHWYAREAQLRAALEAPVDDLRDERALQPGLIDWRGMALAMEQEQAQEQPPADADAPQDAASDTDEAEDALTPEALPAYGQLWALGFITVTELWADDWAPPRDKEIAADMTDALDCVAALLDDDTVTPAFNFFDDDAPPSTSAARIDAFGEALWAVYDLYAIAKSLGPRAAPVRHTGKVGRNDPCPCGSGKKHKKCCGA